jgi:hypothetical protein
MMLPFSPLAFQFILRQRLVAAQHGQFRGEIWAFVVETKALDLT